MAHNKKTNRILYFAGNGAGGNLQRPLLLLSRGQTVAEGFPGDLFYADLNPVVGSEQGGIRPVLVIQNDVGNHFSPTVVAAAITSRKAKNSLPTHILLENVPGLAPTSLLLLEQLRTIDRKRLRGYIGRISKEKMLEVDAALAISIGIGYPNERRTHNV